MFVAGGFGSHIAHESDETIRPLRLQVPDLNLPANLADRLRADGGWVFGCKPLIRNDWILA
jgi:hypothetical protein